MTDFLPAPTLKDIAHAAGVSVASVSKVLNNRGGVGEDSRRVILECARTLGYQLPAARSLSRAGIETCVLIVPAQIYSGSAFYEDVVEAVLAEAEANSLHLDIRLVSVDNEAALLEIDEMITEMKPSAFIALGIDHPTIIDRIVACNVPAVVINGMDRTMRLSCVLPDNWAAGWLATRRLLAEGHREIVHITYPRRLSLQRRLDGFKVALEEAGLAFDSERNVFDLGQLGMRDPEIIVAIRNAFDQGRYADATAFFCGNDHIAISVIQALRRQGHSVPSHYSIIGIDDTALAQRSNPPLTSMRIDRSELGRLGVQTLLERIADPSANVQRINLGVKLVDRASIAPPRLDPIARKS